MWVFGMISRLVPPLLVLAMGCASVSPGYADSVRGLEIAKTMRDRDNGFGNYTAEMEMVLISTAGKERVRRLRVKTLEVEGDGDKSVAVFDLPADVKGTAFLTHTHIKSPDDQWLYLPSLKRVKRIASANKKAPFMGSEFSYEDLVSFEVEKYTYKYLRDEVIDDRPSFVIERYPIDKHSGYSRQVVWVDQDLYVETKIDYYDRRKEKLKTLLTSGFKQFLDRYWRATEMRMRNHQSERTSVLRWSNYRFRQNLGEQDFRPSSLKRIH